MTQAKISPANDTPDDNHPTEAAKALRRRVYEAIEDVYDDKLRCYRMALGGRHSDESISKRLQCAAALVAKVREEFFGPAAPDEPTEEIKSISTDLAHLLRETKEWENLAAGLKKQAVDLRKMATCIEQRLKKLCEAHGWYS